MEDDLGNTDLDVNGEMPIPEGVARWVPAIVVVGAVVGFVALAWYAYHAGTQSLSDDNLMVVEADKTPVKEKPVDPGGMKFPDQDKTIFDTFSNGNNAPPKVERVLPGPEEPMPKQMDTSDTTTWVNQDNVSQKPGSQPGKPEQVIGSDDKKPAVAAAPVEPKLPDNLSPVKTVDSGISSYTASKTVPKVVKADNADNAPAVSATVAPANESAKAPSKPFMPPPSAPAKTVKAGAISSKVRVQLGAYRSEKEATDALVAMQKKFPAIADKIPVIIKADLGDKGIYYRLRIGGFTNAADAKSFCGGLSAKGQACIPAE